jgi:DNA-binding NarL/FixJ family response regulator
LEAAACHSGWPAGPISFSELRDIWSDLLDGKLMISRHVLSPSVCYAELSMPEKALPSLSNRDRAILDRWLRAEPMKSIAIDLHCSLSNVSIIASRTVHRLGIPAPHSRAPMFLALLAHVAATSSARHHASSVRFEGAPTKRGILFMRPDLWLRRTVSPAEADVVGQLLRGDAYTTIAASRATSTRTVANQVSHVYSKFHVSGRLELLLRTICQGDGDCRTALLSSKETQHAA